MAAPGEGLRAGAREVAAKLRDAGFEAYFAGGCVRDLLRGEQPKDYDVVTDARPEQVTKVFRRTVQVGAAFGVVRVLLGQGREYEVATYRTESGYTDGRRPDHVVYSRSKEEDVHRRDFTINALLMDPETEEIFDAVGGRADLEARVIRAVGDPDARFGEDRLRMLRAVRFAARFGFEIEAKTREVMSAHAPDIRVVSVERIVTELEGIWASPAPERGLSLLAETGLFQALFPAIVPGEELHAQLGRLPAAGVALEGRAKLDVAWATVFAGLEPRALEDQLLALKLSRADLRGILRLARVRPLLLEPARGARADLVRQVIDPEHPSARVYLEVLAGRGTPAAQVWAQVEADLAAEPLPRLPVLSGKDLEQLGYAPGPRFKEILAGVEVEVLERRIRTRDEAVAWVGARFPP